MAFFFTKYLIYAHVWLGRISKRDLDYSDKYGVEQKNLKNLEKEQSFFYFTENRTKSFDSKIALLH
jgi:hypothetical protein